MRHTSDGAARRKSKVNLSALFLIDAYESQTLLHIEIIE